MRWLGLFLVSACLEPPAKLPNPFDAGQRDVTCHLLDWRGQERLFEHIDHEPSTFEPLPTPLCWCGLSPGFASCGFNPSLNRFDGACSGCGRLSCRGGTLLEGTGCSCSATEFNGGLRCELDGGETCECPGLCATAARFSFCRCEDGLPGQLECPDGGAGACDCSRTRPYFLDGGR